MWSASLVIIAALCSALSVASLIANISKGGEILRTRHHPNLRRRLSVACVCFYQRGAARLRARSAAAAVWRSAHELGVPVWGRRGATSDERRNSIIKANGVSFISALFTSNPKFPVSRVVYGTLFFFPLNISAVMVLVQTYGVPRSDGSAC